MATKRRKRQATITLRTGEKREAASSETAIDDLLAHAPHNVMRSGITFHELPDDRLALFAAIEVWNKRSEHPLAPYVSDILIAVEDAIRRGDEEALHVPAKWARERIGYPTKQSELTTKFHAMIEGWLTRTVGRDYFQLADKDLASVLADASAGWLAVYAPHLVGKEFIQPSRPGSREAMIRGVRKVARRSRPDAKAFAVALLKGWGMDESKARDALKRCDV